jgi:hypothetical protein
VLYNLNRESKGKKESGIRNVHSLPYTSSTKDNLCSLSMSGEKKIKFSTFFLDLPVIKLSLPCEESF